MGEPLNKFDKLIKSKITEIIILGDRYEALSVFSIASLNRGVRIILLLGKCFKWIFR